MFNSPLRYPGGKNKLAAFIAKLCIDNGIKGHYVEPYSGGASVALFLLIEGFVKNITINDMDRSIYAFWYSVLNFTDDLCEMIANTDVTVANWRLQKEVQRGKETSDLLTLGFSTLFLNRANRSGIILGGPIGGMSQEGTYTIDCRFNKEEIISRIRRIARHKSKISLYQMDAVDLIDYIQRTQRKLSDVIFYFDPPYYRKASSLYMNHYHFENHSQVSDKIKNIMEIRWVVSYDNVPEIKKLYIDCPKKEYSFKHTAGPTKVGLELLLFSQNLVLPSVPDWNPIKFKVRRCTTSQKIVRIGYKGIRSVSSEPILTLFDK